MEIVPFTSIGQLAFGMTQANIRALLGSRFHSFRKTADAQGETDAYEHLHMHLYYNRDSCLDLVEVLAPAGVVFKGCTLFEQDVSSIVDRLRESGEDVLLTLDGPVIRSAGISFYVPHGTRAQTVAVFDRGRFGRHMNLVNRIEEKRRRRGARRAEHGYPKNPFGE